MTFISMVRTPCTSYNSLTYGANGASKQAIVAYHDLGVHGARSVAVSREGVRRMGRAPGRLHDVTTCIAYCERRGAVIDPPVSECRMTSLECMALGSKRCRR